MNFISIFKQNYFFLLFFFLFITYLKYFLSTFYFLRSCTCQKSMPNAHWMKLYREQSFTHPYIFHYVFGKYQLINIPRFDFHLRYSEFIFGKYLHFALRFTPLVSAYMAIIMCSDRVYGEACFILQSFILTSQQWAVRKGMIQTPQPHWTPQREKNGIVKRTAGLSLGRQFSTMIMSFWYIFAIEGS